ncbi:transposable element Tc1 transposase [Nephila pilipes]|uniref:Transposable element Tc1 transposase n=1 Tax=Nephila pilipes TaxID=299642 RepID=A0A8X6PUJ8_NEPPI|nr:transposable element Tc1 transposase [Nephila pilipes]
MTLVKSRKFSFSKDNTFRINPDKARKVTANKARLVNQDKGSRYSIGRDRLRRGGVTECYRVRLWRRRGDRSFPAAVVEQPPPRGIIVWASFAYDYKSLLVLIRGTMTVQRYAADVLWAADTPLPSGVSNGLYQQDNARLRSARISPRDLQAVEMLLWLLLSPDISLIEFIWDEIGCPL